MDTNVVLALESEQARVPQDVRWAARGAFESASYMARPCHQPLHNGRCGSAFPASSRSLQRSCVRTMLANVHALRPTRRQEQLGGAM